VDASSRAKIQTGNATNVSINGVPVSSDIENKLCLGWRLFPRASSATSRQEGTIAAKNLCHFGRRAVRHRVAACRGVSNGERSFASSRQRQLWAHVANACGAHALVLVVGGPPYI
jgi:hypothetical protein